MTCFEENRACEVSIEEKHFCTFGKYHRLLTWTMLHLVVPVLDVLLLL